jgi:5-methyltetrahydropteroyltriglutamate--homocysteine methyltransferase
MLPDFLDMTVNEIHIEMANREFAEIELLKPFAEKMNVAVGIVDVKNYYIETVDDVVERINRCLKYVPAERLSVAPDCGLSQTARWASRQKLANMVKGAKKVRETL